ncbi:MAG: hypothetical protein C0624_01255 [Desulfuromonas sp.]|nr:MAG: hypothetical protein C0624_01255 [Desulfuromonas sp.]
MTRNSCTTLCKTILLLTLLCLPAPCLAESLVAVILPGNLPRYQVAHEAFQKIMDVGGKGKVKLIVKRPNPDKMSLSNDIRRLVGAGAKAIVTYGATATLVAQKVARGVPIIFADVCDPVSLGIVKSLQSTGVETTGAACKTPMSDLLDAMLQVNKPKTIGALYSRDEPASVLQTDALAKLSSNHGINFVKAEAKTSQKAASAMTSLAKNADVIYISDCSSAQMNPSEVMQAADNAKIPVISQIPGLGAEGALLTLEADPTEQGKLIAVHTLQIVSGQSAHQLPVRTPRKINMVVNKKTATKLGLTIPPELLNSVGRVIE